MTLIHVPRPPKSAKDPSRPVSSLLIAQITHLQHAERRLPERYRTQIYSHAIRTEGEAAQYIREVTEAIHQAHDDAAAKRVKRMPKGKRGLALAAAAERPRRKSVTKKKSAAKRGRRK